MGIAGSPDNFQGTMSELIEPLECVQAYLDDLLCISKGSVEDHLEKLEEALRQLHNAGLKVNAEKLTFCTLEIEYLVYVLTRAASNLRVIRCRQYSQLNCPPEQNNSDIFLAWCNIAVTSGQKEQNACHSHLIGRRVQSDQSHQGRRNQKGDLALGRGPSKSFQSHKGYYCKRCILGLSRLFKSI
jgi:hypothetical protein